MREVPSCLNRRYQALDKLIDELTEQHQGCCGSRVCAHDPEIQLMCKFWSILKEDPDCDLPVCLVKDEEHTYSGVASVFRRSLISKAQVGAILPEPAQDKLIDELTKQHQGCCSSRECAHDPEIQLMCYFWSILKEDPDCDLPQAIQHRLCMQKSESGSVFAHQRISCYMATEDNRGSPPRDREDKTCVGAVWEPPSPEQPRAEPEMKCCTSRDAAGPPQSKDDMPLSKVLCNLKEAASFDRKCHIRMNNLIESERMLQEQIKYLEEKEKKGVEMLQEADCMWSCMEDSYKKKIQESLERQKYLLTQLKDVEKSTSKWRTNKKDLESQLQTLSKCQEEIKDKINQKNNDIKTMNKEIEDYKKRIEANKKESEASKKSLAGKKLASDEKLARIANQIKKLQEELAKEQVFKADKENEGNMYIREAREDLQNICKLLLLKKLEHEDLSAEKNALILEMNLLKESCGQCKDRCKNKQVSIDQELVRLDQEIEGNRNKCLKCHKCLDTADVTKYCGDCPRCQAEIDCIYNEDHCVRDESMDCVCQVVKQKFLDNVFDNMYTVLERQAKTGPGKAVAEAVLDCLRRSRNGKLNPETRKILQQFILSTVKKNLNLTIVGGAVKTRCEMEPEMYEKLMLCLKTITPTKPPKTDATTDVKKEPCKRWGGSRECQCNKGPNACICTKKAPPPIKDPNKTPCPINKDDEEERCHIHKDNLCGPECSYRAKGRGPCGGIPDPEDLGDLAQYMPPPCQGPSCPYTKDMRAARCVFGSEPLSSNQSFKTAVSSFDPAIDSTAIMCKCGSTSVKPCTCQDPKQLKAILDKNLNFKSCCIEQDECSPTGDKTKKNVKEKSLQVKLKKVPSVLTDIISKSQYEVGTEPLVEYRNKGTKTTDRKTHSNKKSSSGKFQGDLTEVKSTYSGVLFLELDDKTISKIKERTIECSQVPIAIKHTESGNYLIDFDSDENTSNDRKITLNKSCSGAMFLEVDKEIVNNLHPYLRTNHSKPSVSIGIVRKKESCDCEEEQKIRRKTKSITHFMQNLGQYERVEKRTKQKTPKIVDTPTPNSAKTTSKDNSSNALFKRCKSIDDYKAELMRYTIGSKRPHITIKVQGENGVVGNTQAEVIETSSGNIAVSVKKEDLSHIGYIAARSKELPVLLKRLSGTYTLYLQRQLVNKAPNTVLRRSASGNFLIVITEPVLSSLHRTQLSEHSSKEKMFKIKVKGTKDEGKLIEPPALLKLTPSENYLLVLDKEFEKEHKACFDHFEDESFVELEKTDSDAVLINFDEGDSIHNKQNALLVRSLSGGMKILVNGPVFDMLALPGSNRSLAAQALEEILLKQNINKHSDTKNHEVRLLGVKSSSDSTLYAKHKHPTRNMNLNTASLKRTDSGKYAMLLQKNYKRNFINNLKSYLSTRNHGLVPILKGNKPEEITIDLNSHKHENDQCGSLKITPSGNIFITVDEKFVSTVSNRTENRETCKTADFGQYVMNDELDFSPKRSTIKCYKSDVKSSSHCDLFEKAKSRLQNQRGLLDGSSATVKKTGSGHFLVILNKESKKAFINDVRSCLRNQSQDRIKFWRGTESEGIKIDLSGMKNKTDNCGSLKITNSGKIYVIVDEKQLKNITKDIERNNYAVTSVADVVLKNVFPPPPPKTSFAESEPENQNLSNTAKEFQNKNTATHCKGKPNDITCTRSKCMCFEGEDIDSKYDEGTSSLYKYSKTAPHIVIRPCGCQTPKQKYMSHEQCFYVMDSVCPVHKDRYKTVSNEIIEISGKCNKTKRSKKKASKPKKHIKVNVEESRLDWDALSNLPPQLPPFLRNFQAKKYTK